MAQTGRHALARHQTTIHAVLLYSKNPAPMNFSVVSHKFLCSSHKLCGLNTPCCDTSSENEAAISCHSILFLHTKSTNDETSHPTSKHRSNHDLISSIMIQPSPLRRGINNILTKLAHPAAAQLANIQIQRFCRPIGSRI